MNVKSNINSYCNEFMQMEIYILCQNKYENKYEHLTLLEILI